MSLIDDLVADKPRRVLDVGCGTGKAARLFAARGCQVLGVEPDDRMATVARSHEIPVEVATFEAWDPSGRTFDIVASAQAWHWVDKELGLRKAAAVLGSGAKLAVFWNNGTHDAETRSLLDEAYARYAPELSVASAPRGAVKQTNSEHIDAIVATGRFETPEIRRSDWVKRYTRDDWLDQLGTHSDHLLLPPSQFQELSAAVAAAIDRLGGEITLWFRTELILARRK